MKTFNRIFVIIITAILFGMLFPIAASANAAEPPALTVIAINPPDDLSIALRLPDQSSMHAIELKKEKKAWETYYRFFYHMSPIGNDNLEGSVLIVQSSERSFQCNLPVGAFKMYNNILTLNMKTESLAIGQPPARVPVLVALRVALTLLIEGAIFFLFGYRQKRSWIAFIAINIITQGWLNAMLTGPRTGTGSYWMIIFYFCEIIIFIAELVAFIAAVREYKKIRAALYSIIANAASLILGGLLIAYLPV